jgi:DNA-binding MarR family transcriptional regulator
MNGCLGYSRAIMDDERMDDPGRESLARALVALCRYTVEMTEIAHQSLGHETTENRDIEMVLTLSRTGPLTPTELAEVTGAPRSSVSRALNRLESAGLISRGRDSRDARSVLIAVTPKGRRRVAAFGARLNLYYASGEPLLKEAFDTLGVPVPEPDPIRPVDAMAATTVVTSAGAAFVADAAGSLQPLGVREFADRFTVALLQMHGTQRPTQISDELRLTPSGTSGVLTRLERAGLITRRHDLTPGDRRAVIVGLTPRGRQAADVQLDIFARHSEALTRALSLTWGGH